MREISNIKNNIKQFLDFKGISKYKFYKETNITRGILDQNNGISEENTARFIAHYPEVNIEWLITGKGEMLKTDKNQTSYTEDIDSIVTEGDAQYGNKIPLIPISAIAGPGKGVQTITENDILERYDIPEFTSKGVDYIIRVSGDSMHPTYSNGDLLGIKQITDTSFFQWGKAYVIDTDQGAMVKRLFEVAGEPDMLECRSDNKEHYPSFNINKSSIYSISIVLGVLRME